MNGKSKCKILKDIRRQIAQDNEIEYIATECKFQGECSGTCPKCEAELRYLEDELRKRQAMGKAIAIAGLAATLMVGTVGCDSPPIGATQGMMAPPAESEIVTPENTELPDMGDVVVPETGDYELMGDLIPDPTQESTNDGL